MEETVRSMLVYKKQAEQLRQEKAALTVAFEVSYSHDKHIKMIKFYFTLIVSKCASFFLIFSD